MNEQNKKIENKLLVKNEFLQLDKLLNRFNIFEATDMGRREIKHTKFLSYLLDPNESHGLGEVFIKNFITRLSEKIEDFPRILDLDFSFAEIKSEFKVSDKSQHSIDCFIQIPLRGQTEKAIFIAIENKIDAKQGQNQLKIYSNLLEEYKSDLYKIYLTFHEEEPNQEEPNQEVKKWINATYDAIVLPSLKLTMELIEDTGSPNLKAALNDYLELLIEDEDGDREKEQLSNQLSQDSEIKNYFSLGKSNRRSYFGDMYIKHKKVVDYICEQDNVKTSLSLAWWNELKKANQTFSFPDDGQELIFKYETSVRSYLRFNLLTELNRKRLTALNRESKNWLASRCPIAFEIVIKSIYEKTDDSNPTKIRKLTDQVNCQATLVLGPLDSNQVRSDLFNHLFKALKRVILPNTSPKDEYFEGVWNRLISNKSSEWPEGKLTVTEDAKKWIEEFILKNENGSVKLNKWIEDLSIRLNKSLDEYFNNSTMEIQ